jgi:hypothetical protein
VHVVCEPVEQGGRDDREIAPKHAMRRNRG